MDHVPELHFEWKRPIDYPYPTVWQTFKDLDLDSDNEVEYCIQDLPETRFDDAIQHMTEHYLPDEPVGQSFDCTKEQGFVEDWQRAWRLVMDQKMSIACFKEDSDEIIALNLTFVTTKNDNIMEYIKAISTNFNTARFWGAFDKLYQIQVIDPFKKYNVDKYLGSLGLSVARNYRGRGIGEKMLTTRKYLGKAFDIKLTHNGFSNEISSRIADRVGFQLEGEIYYDESTNSNPEYASPDIKRQKAAVKTWVF